MFTVKRKIGDTVYEVSADEKDERENFAHTLWLAQAPKKCGLCESTDVHLSVNKATSDKDGKTYTFVKMLCNNCNARAQLGEYQTGGFFWKGWEEYTPPAKRRKAAPPESDEQSEDPVDDIPF